MTRLVIFDVDGTLVDSQGAITRAMTAAFVDNALPAPDLGDILAIVGLSLEQAMLKLAPHRSAGQRANLVEAYKDAYHSQRVLAGAASGSPLFPGALDTLHALARQDGVLLGVATGKSRRGLDALLDAHGLTHLFVTTQVADDHPSKPHPSMIDAALTETGCDAGRAAMIGDTTFDMQMATAAGVAGVAVGWGYHPAENLRAHSDHLIDVFERLPAKLNDIWGIRQ